MKCQEAVRTEMLNFTVGGSSSPSRTASPSRQATTAPQPTMHHQQHAPMQAPPQSGGMLSGIGGTIMTGMALGAGSEIGH